MPLNPFRRYDNMAYPELRRPIRPNPRVDNTPIPYKAGMLENLHHTNRALFGKSLTNHFLKWKKKYRLTAIPPRYMHRPRINDFMENQPNLAEPELSIMLLYPPKQACYRIYTIQTTPFFERHWLTVSKNKKKILGWPASLRDICTFPESTISGKIVNEPIWSTACLHHVNGCVHAPPPPHKKSLYPSDSISQWSKLQKKHRFHHPRQIYLHLRTSIPWNEEKAPFITHYSKGL